jgi:hypothetical protein
VTAISGFTYKVRVVVDRMLYTGDIFGFFMEGRGACCDFCYTFRSVFQLLVSYILPLCAILLIFMNNSDTVYFNLDFGMEFTMVYFQFKNGLLCTPPPPKFYLEKVKQKFQGTPHHILC